MEQMNRDSKPVIKLFKAPAVLGLPGSGSPPCIKLETWLRIAGVPYELGEWPSMTKPAPKGKIPYIEDDGVLIGDSTFILEHIKRTRQVDPDEGLTPTERAIGLAFRRMIKENLYWALMHVRYHDEANWEIWRKTLLSMLVPSGAPDAAVQQGLEIVDGIRKTVLEQLHAHGIGRHTPAEVYQIGIADLGAISDFLGDKPFFFGDRPTGTDAAVYAHVATAVELPFEGPCSQFARERQNLVDYSRRMRARFFAD